MSPVRMRITWAWVQSMGFISKPTNTWMPHWTWIWVLSAYISIFESQSGTGSMTSIHGLVQNWVLRVWIPVLYLRSVMGGSRSRSRSRSKSIFVIWIWFLVQYWLTQLKSNPLSSLVLTFVLLPLINLSLLNLTTDSVGPSGSWWEFWQSG